MQAHKYLFLVCLIAFGVRCDWLSPDVNKVGAIKVVVLDLEDRPLSGATVAIELINKGDLEFDIQPKNTNADGSVLFENLKVSYEGLDKTQYRVTASKTMYLTKESDPIGVRNEVTDTLNLSLAFDPAFEVGNLVVEVKNQNMPVNLARVKIEPQDASRPSNETKELDTDSNGRVEFVNIKAQSYFVTVSKEAFIEKRNIEITVEHDQTRTEQVILDLGFEEDESNDKASEANEVELEDGIPLLVVGELDGADSDWFEIEPTFNGVLTISVEQRMAQSTESITLEYLLDTSNPGGPFNLVGPDSKSITPDGIAQFSDIAVAEGSSYYVKLTTTNGLKYLASFLLDKGAVQDDFAEPNELGQDNSQIPLIPIDTTITAFVGGYDNEDYYRFIAPFNGTFSFIITNLNPDRVDLGDLDQVNVFDFLVSENEARIHSFGDIVLPGKTVDSTVLETVGGREYIIKLHPSYRGSRNEEEIKPTRHFAPYRVELRFQPR